MSKAVTRLTLENSEEGVINTTLDVTLSNGESMRLSFRLPKRLQPQTIHEIEQAMLQRAQDIAARMLQN